jgi:class 3 adenylate cyclase
METMIRDIEAVVDRTQPGVFSVVAFLHAVPIAVTYAAAHPDQVTHLVLIDGWAGGDDVADMPGRKAVDALMGQDFTLITETMVKVVWGFDDPRLIEIGGEYIRACIEPEAFRAFTAEAKNYDVTALLANVRAKTLVLHNEKNNVTPVRAGQKLAAGIPDARFQILDDMSYQRVAPLILEFLGASPKSASSEPSTVHTILFTDVEGSTALTDRLGDAEARELLRQHERITREALAAHGGAEIKTMGDGFMASFTSTSKAVECAIAIQRAFAKRNESAAEPIKVRVGLNAGEPIAEDDPGGRGDLFGTAVNMAARIASKADAGEILAANVVRELVAGKDFLFNDRGDTELRGFEDPVRLFEVRWALD